MISRKILKILFRKRWTNALLSSIITLVKQLLENSYLQMIRVIVTPCDCLQNRREVYFSAFFQKIAKSQTNLRRRILYQAGYKKKLA